MFRSVVFALALALVTLLVGACSPAAPAPAPTPTAGAELAVHFVDVGQGDAILVRTPEGKVMVIDGGPRQSGLVAYMRKVGVQQVDVIVGTNPDADHFGGLVDVLNAFPVKEVWISGQPNTTLTFERFVDAVAKSGAKGVTTRRGDIIKLGSLEARVLHPVDPLFSDRNNNSVVVRLEFGKVSFLFTGDAERRAEESMLNAGVPLRSTVLKVGHHGSRTSSSPPFIAVVRPEVAVYQAASGNSYGHPHRETLQTLAAAGVQVYGTDTRGAVVVRTDGQTYQVTTER